MESTNSFFMVLSLSQFEQSGAERNGIVEYLMRDPE
jgi:hypothetical protein